MLFILLTRIESREKVRRSRLRIPRLKRNSVVAAAAAAARKVAERKRKRKMEAKKQRLVWSLYFTSGKSCDARL